MIIVTLRPAHEVDPDTDELGRSAVGWYPGMPPDQLRAAGRGCWKLGERAGHERYVLFVAQDRVRGAMEIQGFTRHGDRRAIEGEMLGAGHPIHDTYVGGPDPSASRTRNPIHYWEPGSDKTTCGCGCGAPTDRDFLPGHDQRAIHDRISRAFRSVREFLVWFDQQFPAEGEAAA
jgi:hypothetical protein